MLGVGKIKNRVIDIKKENLPKRLFLFNISAAFVLALGFIVYVLMKDNRREYLLYKVSVAFSDFSQMMRFAVDKPYDAPLYSSYPPLAILIFSYPFAFICRDVIHLSNFDIVQTSQFWISFCLFYVLFFVAAALLVKKLTGLKGKRFVYFCLALVTAGPVLYMISRGNIILTAFVFLLFYLAFYNSKNHVLREMALISLALAGTIKIYPLCFGALLLTDKKIFPAIRVAIYTVILFFVPFLFFKGGFSTVNLFFQNLNHFSGEYQRLRSMRNVSLSAFVYKFFYIIDMFFSFSFVSAEKIISSILIVAIAVMFIIGVLLSKDRLSSSIVCSLAMMLIPPVSYYYTAIFLIVPIIFFVNDYEKLSLERKNFYLIFFTVVGCIVCCPVSALFTPFLAAVLFYEAIRVVKNYNRDKQKRVT